MNFAENFETLPVFGNVYRNMAGSLAVLSKKLGDMMKGGSEE